MTHHGMVLDGAPTLPQLKAFLTAAGELFPGVCTAGSSLLLCDISQCCSSLLAPLATRNHKGPWEFPSCSASSCRSCTNQRQSVSRSCRGGWAMGPLGKGVGWSCWRLREAHKAGVESHAFPLASQVEKLQPAPKSGTVSERTQLRQL